MRVLFVAIAVLTVGFLGFVPMLRLALTSRSKVDWRVFIGVAATQLVCWIGVFSDPGGEEFTSWYGNAAMGLMLINLAVSVTYYLIADIRHARRHQLAMAPAMYGRPPQQPPYGYPQPQPQPQPRPQPYTQPPTPQNQGQPPQRIDQVRAELDELSDYLRKRDGGR